MSCASIVVDVACTSDSDAALAAAPEVDGMAISGRSAATGDLPSPAPNACPSCPIGTSALGDLSSPMPKARIFLASTCGFAFKVFIISSTASVMLREGAPCHVDVPKLGVFGHLTL